MCRTHQVDTSELVDIIIYTNGEHFTLLRLKGDKTYSLGSRGGASYRYLSPKGELDNLIEHVKFNQEGKGIAFEEYPCLFERGTQYSLPNVLLSLNAKFRHDEVFSFLQSNPDPVPNPNPAPVDPPGKRDRSEVVVSTSRGGPAVTQQETLQYLDTEVMLGITYGALLLVQKIGWDTFDDTYNIYTNILTLEVGGSKVEFIQDDLFVR